MNDGEAQALYYKEIVARINQLYGTTCDEEHEYINEFYEGPIPTFKLILSQDDPDRVGVMIISFHIEVEAAVAIQWFLRVRQLEPNLHITACYLRDADGVSYVGEDAHILRAYMIEQDILGAYIASDKGPEDVVNKKVQSIKPSPIKAYSDYRTALVAFQKLDKKKGAIEH